MAEAHDPATAEVADSADRQPDLKLEIQALQILDSSYDCIKVLDLEGHILFVSRGGQVLLGIQDITPFINTSWIEFWQGADRQSAIEATARARAGEVCTFQGYCAALSGESKWWDIKISPIRGTEGQVERLLCISRDITERRQIEDRCKQAEQKSRELEQWYQAIINQAVTGAACTDFDGRLTVVNQKYCDITGYCADELRQLRMQDITHPEDLPRNLELFNRMRSEGTPFEIEKRYIRKDGSIVWVNNSVSVICDRDGKPQSAVAIVLDITDRKQSEAALRVSEEQFRLFTTASSDTVYKMSADWSVMQSLVGQQFIPSTLNPSRNWLATYIPEDEQPRVQAAIAEAIRTKRNFELEHRVIREDGTIGWTFSRAIPLLNEQGEIVEWFGSASDVTERKHTEAALRESEEKFRTLADTAPALIWYDDARGENRFINQHFLDFTGRSAEQIRGEGWQELLHPDDAEDYIADYLAAVRQQRPWHNRNRIRRHDGVWRWHDNYAQPLFNADGVYLGHVGVTIDNTDAIEAEIALRESEARLAVELMDARQLQFISSQLIQEENIDALYEQILEAAIALMRSDMGSMQVLHPENNELQLLIWKGFDPASAAFWQWVRVDSESSCGVALKTGERSIVPDVEACEFVTGSGDLDAFRRSGIRAVQTTPLVSRSGRVVGMISTQWQEPHQPSERELGLLDVLARQAADLIEQRQAEAALRESEARLQSIANLVLELLWDSEPDGSTNWYNQRWMEYTGQTFEQAIGWGWTDAIHPDDREGSARRYREAVEQGMPLQQEHRIRRHDGAYRWFFVKASPLKDESGKVIKMYAAATDIHEQRVALEALRESEAKYRSLFNAMDEGYMLSEVIFDENDKPIDILYLEANPAAIRLAGRDFSGQRLRDIDPNYEEYWYETYGRTALAGEAVRAERYAAPHGRWFDFYAFKVGERESRRIATVFQDITDRKRADLALRESEERLRDVLNSMSEGFALLGGDFTILDVNEETLRLDGRSRDELIGRSHWDAFPGTEDSPVGEIFRRVARERTPASLEHVYRWLDGRSLWIDMRAYPTRNDGVAIFWRDVSDRKQAEAALRESEEKYRSLFNSMDEAYAVVEVMTGENGEWNDFLFLEVNPAFVKQTGMEYPVGRTATELLGTPNPQWAKVYGRVAETGEPIRFEEAEATLGRVFDLYVFRLGGEGSRRVAVLFTDITDRKRHEQRQNYLLKLSDALRPLSDAAQIEGIACRLLGEELKSDRAFYSEISEAEDYVKITQDYLGGDSPTLAGIHPLSASSWVIPLSYKGEPIIISDVYNTDLIPPANLPAMEAAQVISYILIPLIKNNVLVGTLTASESVPRQWNEYEVALLTETAERIWAAVERAKAEEALREAQESLQIAVEAAEMGTWDLDLTKDSSGRRSLRHDRVFGYDDLQPEWGQEIARRHVVEEDLEIFDGAFARALETGELKFEVRLRWSDGSIHWMACNGRFYFDADGKPVRGAGVNFDITDRKHAEEQLRRAAQMDAFRVKLSDALRSLSDPVQIQAQACRLLGEQLGVDRAFYVEIYEAQGYARVNQHYSRGGSPSIVGDYPLAEYGWSMQIMRRGETIVVADTQSSNLVPDAERAAMAMLQMVGFVALPPIKGEVLVGALTLNEPIPREWTEAEVDLVRETAERIWADIQRAHAETALYESEQKYRTLFDSIDEGFAITEIIYDDQGEIVDIIYRQVNRAYERHSGVYDAVGRSIFDIIPGVEDYWLDLYKRVARTGESVREENYQQDVDRWFDVYFSRIDDNGRFVAIVFSDISDRKRDEQRRAYLLRLSDALRSVSDASEIEKAVTAEALHFFDSDRCYYCTIEEGSAIIRRDAFRAGLHSIAGSYPLNQFDLFNVVLKTGLPFVANDVHTSELVNEALLSLVLGVNIQSFLNVPVVKANEVVGVFTVAQSAPRTWTSMEIAIAAETAERTWAAAESAKAEQALRESEAKYRSLFTSIDEGFTLLETIPDESGHPADFRIVETNPVWEQQTGLTDAVGKTLLEVVPNFEQQWLDFYSDVAISGRGRRIEYYTASVNRWYTVYASRIGGEGSRQVAVVFNDITERKRAEEHQAFLLKLSDAFRAHTSSEAIGAFATRMVAEYMHVDRCYIARFSREEERGWIGPEYRSSGLPPLSGEYRFADFPEGMRRIETGPLIVRDLLNDESLSDNDKQSIGQAMGLHGMLAAVLRRGERNAFWCLTAATTEPRDWTEGELKFLEDVAERTWAAMERARTEAALRESEERLQKAISIETVGVLFFTLDGQITDANDTFLRMSGYSRDELRNIADWQELTPPEFWDATSGAAQELATLGKAAPYEKQHIRKDGSRWWGLFSPTRLKASGRNAECVEFVTDISDRKQAEAAIAADLRDTQLLRELSARLATEDNIQALYQEIMATAIALTQADAGTVQILDETTQDLVVLATQGFEQKMVEHFHRVNASSNTPCGIALRSGVRSFVDFDVPESEDPEGSMRLHVEGGLLCAQSTPLISRSGKPIGMVSTHWRTRHRPSDRELRFLDLLARQAADLIEQRQDVAQRQQLLEREQAAREEGERANRIKDEFLAVLSHELRSPLNPILGWSTLLLSGKIDATKTTQALTTIQRNAKLQLELIDDLLDIARIMRGKLSINVAAVNLAFAIRAAMETVRLAAEAKSIQIAASLAEDVGLVLGDSTRLQQVVWNLLSNAVKFTPAGGQVSIRLERFDSSAQITVSDTGQGIAPDFLPFVFNYFRQADGATTRKFGGLGLGLAIVRQLVELHGGTVSVASPGLGQGTTFTVRVPLMSASSETNQDVRSVQQFLDLSGIKILIVDDETDTREWVAFVLEQQSAEVMVATCAREALLVLPQAKPDILVSDIGMPEMDGYMLIQRVRRLTPEQGGRIPAIALTAYAGDTNQQQVLAAGFQKHISKPIQPEVLVQAIADLIHPN